LTNTPALAGVLEALKARLGENAAASLLAEPTVAYSIAYPMGVIAMLLAVHFGARLFRVDYKAESKASGGGEPITHRSVRVTRLDNARVGDLALEHERRVLFGRLKHSGTLLVPDVETRLQRGDVVSVIGTDQDVQAVIAELGEPADEALELDRSSLDFRRVFVSDARIAGQRVGNLHLPQRFGAIITRVRRGDVDLLPNGDTVLELGDRVRVLCPRENMTAVSRFFGDSYKAVSEIDIMTLGVGVALGLLLGSIVIPLPGGTTFKLGSAAGPLLVSLVLGALGRTGPILWQLPYSANLTLRQFGLTIFLAGIGTKAGYSFASSVSGTTGIYLFVAGTVITAGAAIITLWAGHRLLKIPYGTLTGMLGGLQTQPAVLAFANEKAGNEMPNVGSATVYPVAMIMKIVLAQVLLLLVR
ncbi:MAG TPA: TrkA C-terminal domain-containing protein, partial [Deinococcales bacterium]|nr:TrkA C-terminal domain-containing protein [Deinococcales bacterium]